MTLTSAKGSELTPDSRTPEVFVATPTSAPHHGPSRIADTAVPVMSR